MEMTHGYNMEVRLYKLQAKLDAALKDVERLKRELAVALAERDAARDALCPVRAERDAALKDATRYRWLRMQSWDRDYYCVVENPKENCRLGSFLPNEEILDDIIDSALIDDDATGDEEGK
jgi:hypothetical protein